MKSWFRAMGAFMYALIISVAFLFLAVFLLSKGIVAVSGFLKTAIMIIGIVVLVAWLSEKGLELLSIPFNWLWDRSKKTRIATAIPAVLIGLWCLSAPIRIPVKFTTGDWVLVVIWCLGVLVFYVNLFLMPFSSPNMGRD